MSISKKNTLQATLLNKPLILLLTVALLTASVPMMVSADEPETYELSKTFAFSEPTIIYGDDGFYDIDIEGAASKTLLLGGPMMPYTYDRIELPFRATNINVQFSHSQEHTIEMEDTVQIRPAPVPVLLDRPVEAPLLEKLAELLTKVHSLRQSLRYKETSASEVIALDDEIYTSHEAYGEPSDTRIYVGRNDNGELAAFVSYQIMPCTFTSLAGGTLSYFTDATLKITYEIDDTPLPIDDEEE